MTTRNGRPQGYPQAQAAQELVEAGFALESADAPFLHHGLNLADIAHVLDLLRRSIVPPAEARKLLDLLLEVQAMNPAEFPYDAELGEPYNSREFYFVSRIGDAAGWLHAGRPRRESARVALRLHLRGQLLAMVSEVADFVAACVELSERHKSTLMPDQTYLQQAQPSTFGHYLLSFAYPAERDAQRLLDAFDWVNRSPGGAGCVNGTRLLEDRVPVANALGFDGVITHTRDAMWQIDGLVHILATAASLASTLSKLAEDLEIWSSSEFDFVDLDDAFTRSSVLMPQKRNPYALSIARGSSGVLIGRLTGFLAVAKSPSARSDNLIFAYGEVPRALELLRKVTRLMTGVVRTLSVNEARLSQELARGFTQATDLAEYVMLAAGIDYRSAYTVVGEAVRTASQAGLCCADVTADMIDDAARLRLGRPLGLDGRQLRQVLDPAAIVETRVATGGASSVAVSEMTADLSRAVTRLRSEVAVKAARTVQAEDLLLVTARTHPAPTPPEE